MKLAFCNSQNLTAYTVACVLINVTVYNVGVVMEPAGHMWNANIMCPPC